MSDENEVKNYSSQVHPKYFRPNATITYKPLSKPPEAKQKQQQQQHVDMEAAKEVKKETEDDGVSNSR